MGKFFIIKSYRRAGSHAEENYFKIVLASLPTAFIKFTEHCSNAKFSEMVLSVSLMNIAALKRVRADVSFL